MTNRYKVVFRNTLFYIYDNENNRVIESFFIFKYEADAVCKELNRIVCEELNRKEQNNED